MGKIYSPGDIVFFKNVKLIQYNGLKVLDTRINGHPYIILNDVDDFGEVAFCLICSSNEKNKRRKNHIHIKKAKVRGDKTRETYVNIENVYKFEIDKVIAPVGRVSNIVLNELKEKVKKKNYFN